MLSFETNIVPIGWLAQSALSSWFDFLIPEHFLFLQLYAEKVATRGLCAIAQCESLRYKLIGGLAVRRYGFMSFTFYEFSIVLKPWRMWRKLEKDPVNHKAGKWFTHFASKKRW